MLEREPQLLQRYRDRARKKREAAIAHSRDIANTWTVPKKIKADSRRAAAAAAAAAAVGGIAGVSGSGGDSKKSKTEVARMNQELQGSDVLTERESSSAGTRATPRRFIAVFGLVLALGSKVLSSRGMLIGAAEKITILLLLSGLFAALWRPQVHAPLCAHLDRS